MRKITQAEFDNFPVVNEYKTCPSGDYAEIKINAKCKFGDDCKFGHSSEFGNFSKFGDDCKFGDYCKFGHSSKFGDSSTFENGYLAKSKIPFICFGGCGSRDNSVTYVFNFEIIMIRCGCFFGTVDEFNNRVIEKNADPFYIEFVDLAVKKINSLNNK